MEIILQARVTTCDVLVKFFTEKMVNLFRVGYYMGRSLVR